MPDELLDLVRAQREQLCDQAAQLDALKLALRESGDIRRVAKLAQEAQARAADADGRLQEVGAAWHAASAKAAALEALLREWMARFGREARELDQRSVALLSGNPEPEP